MTSNSILRWNLKSPSSSSNNKQTNNRWIHSDETLTNNQIPYLVKFLGKVQVDEPKGLSLVKESIRKLEFFEQLRRAEGEKIQRVELIISVEGVTIRDCKSKQEIHQFPLHRISYCADERSDRKYFSFIAKVQEDSDRHECFVFISDKSSEEITLTIGQAFDLAYRRYLDSSGRDVETKKQLLLAVKKIKALELENKQLKQKLEKYEQNGTQSIFDTNSLFDGPTNTTPGATIQRSSSPSPWTPVSTPVQTAMTSPLTPTQNHRKLGSTSSSTFSDNPFGSDLASASTSNATVTAIAALTLKPPPSKNNKNRNNHNRSIASSSNLYSSSTLGVTSSKLIDDSTKSPRTDVFDDSPF